MQVTASPFPNICFCMSILQRSSKVFKLEPGEHHFQTAQTLQSSAKNNHNWSTQDSVNINDYLFNQH